LNANIETQVSEVRQALYRRDQAAADELVARGAELNEFDLAALGDAQRLRELLVADQSLAGSWSADGFTALHFAAYLGGAEVVEVLIDAGADVCAVARNEMLVQPLHSAVALGDVDACRALLDAGADANAEQQGGYRPLDEALITKNEAVEALLRQRGATVSGNPLPT
jgi:ankyrin repeat protein